MKSNSRTPMSLPVAVVGAGPVGLAAAAHLQERGIDFVLLESGSAVGAAMREWSHVRLFSPWEYNVDTAAERLLRAAGWAAPDPNVHPTGGEIVSQYLEPLSRLPQIASRTMLNAKVVGISRQGRDKMKADAARQTAPFRIRFETAAGEEEILAGAVIDTAGTWRTPNPLGSEGMPARGERALQSVIRYGIPDVLNTDRSRYAGRRVLVAGSGHSAFNVLVDLVRLAEQEPATSITWVVRRDTIGKLFGGGERDKLAARGALGSAVRQLVSSGRLKVELSFQTEAVERKAGGIYVYSDGRMIGPVDEIVVATGFRPDFSYLRELQLGLDAVVESTPMLAPMIDPNLHSCGTVRPHGHAELAHPETGFYVAGMKSYGRAPTFLMRTGYEQVRSIVAALAGDMQAADRVELVLPETGVCTSQFDDDDAAGCCGEKTQALAQAPGSIRRVSVVGKLPLPETGTGRNNVAQEREEIASTARGSGCCGGEPVSDSTACCKKDEAAKAAGESGCGCGDDKGGTKSQLVTAGGCCG